MPRFSDTSCKRGQPITPLRLTDVISSRWYLAEMRRDCTERSSPLLDEETACEHCLRPGIEAPDLATVKDFLRFYIAMSQPRLTNRPIIDRSILSQNDFSLILRM